MCEAGQKPAPSYMELEAQLAASEAARREAEAERDRLQHFMDCAKTPLMADVMAALASERAARESWEREANVANAERIRLHNEVENLAERISQFEAAGFPNVATVLDRVEAERAARVAADKRVAELEAHRTKLDCRFAGRYAEMDGSHCPSGEPCQRCELERAREKAERERDAYRHEWNVSSRQQGAETRARFAAESRLSRATEALREIAANEAYSCKPLRPNVPTLDRSAWCPPCIARRALAEIGGKR